MRQSPVSRSEGDEMQLADFEYEDGFHIPRVGDRAGSLESGGAGAGGSLPRQRHDSPAASGGGASAGGARRMSRIGTDEWLRNEETKRAQQIRTLKHQQEERLAEECTFKPMTNKPKSGKAAHLQNQKKISAEVDMYSRLTGNQKRMYDEREMQRQVQEAEEAKECSFKPVLSARSEEIASRRRVATKGDVDTLVGDKLFHDARVQQCKLRKKVREQTEAELEGLFEPNTQRHREQPGGGGGGLRPSQGGAAAGAVAASAVPASPSEYVVIRKPLHERLDDIKKQRAARMFEIRQKHREESELTFKPTICPRSRSVDAANQYVTDDERVRDDADADAGADAGTAAAAASGSGGAVRLFTESRVQRRSASTRQQLLREREEREGMREAPEISQRSRLIVQQSRDRLCGEGDFLHRQEELLRKREHRMRAIKDEMLRGERGGGGSGGGAAAARSASAKLSGREVDEVVKKMYGDAERKRAKIEMLAKVSVEGMFQPKLSKRSQEWFVEKGGSAADKENSLPGGGSRSVSGGGPRRSTSCGHPEPNLQYSKRQADINKILDERARDEKTNNTYKPQINSHSQQLADQARAKKRDGSLVNDSMMSTYYEQRREQTLRQKAYEEQKISEECTFKPRILSRSRAIADTGLSTSHVAASETEDRPISGFQQFVQRQEHARRVEAEKRRREEQISQVKPSAITNAKKMDDHSRVCTGAGVRNRTAIVVLLMQHITSTHTTACHFHKALQTERRDRPVLQG